LFSVFFHFPIQCAHTKKCGGCQNIRGLGKHPFFFLVILALVFSRIIKLQMENYTIFLFSGV